MKTVEEAIKFRRTMQTFDVTKEVSINDLETILNAGRLAPSALGAEPTRILVVRNKAIKKTLAENAYHKMNWNKINTADSLILFISTKGDIFKSKEYINSKLQRWNLTKKDLEVRTNAYVDYLKFIDCDVYSANQAYISMAYVSLQVSAIGIESVIMQGFDFNKLNNLLQEKGLIDQEQELVYISMAIGHSNQEIRNKLYPQVRKSLEDFSEIIN